MLVDSIVLRWFVDDSLWLLYWLVAVVLFFDLVAWLAGVC